MWLYSLSSCSNVSPDISTEGFSMLTESAFAELVQSAQKNAAAIAQDMWNDFFILCI
jgi:hypothetical protein